MSNVETLVASEHWLPLHGRDLPLTTTRRSIVNVLNDALAHTLDLGLQARRARWNLTGPRFLGFREMLAHMVRDLDAYGDLAAERVVRLGGIAEGRLRAAQERTPPTLPAAPPQVAFRTAVLSLLAVSVASVGAQTRSGFDEVSLLRDTGSADVLAEIASGLETWAWCLEVHLEGVTAA